MALPSRARAENASAVAYLIIRRQAENWLPACGAGIDLTSSDKDCPRHPAARCGRGCPEVSYKTSRHLLTEGSMIRRGAPRARTVAVVMARVCAVAADLGGTHDD